MVIGKNFVWLHIPKTGGDITRELLLELNKKKNFIEKVINIDNPKKHMFYDEVLTEFDDLVENKTFICNFRRLPNWMLSWYWHAKQYGLIHWLRENEELNKYLITNLSKDWIFKRRILPKERYIMELLHLKNHALLTIPDIYYDFYKIEKCKIIRLEHLKVDFIAVFSDLLKLSEEDLAFIRSFKFSVKQPNKYNHDVFSFFTKEETEELYLNNPFWAQKEIELYGGLLI